MDFVDLLTESFWLIFILSLPPLLSSMVIGLLISVFQASTQIQDASLPFVFKVGVVFLSIVIYSHWAIDTITTFTIDLFSTISTYGNR